MGARGNRLNLRFAVGRPGGPQATLWRARSSPKGDVYLAARSLGGIFKYSFHADDGYCHWALTKEYVSRRTAPPPDRVIAKWRRPPTSPRGAGKGSAVLSVGVPTDYLSTAFSAPNKPVRWIDPAPPGDAVRIEMFFTAEPRERVDAGFAERGQRHVLDYAVLPGGEAFVIAWAHVSWEQKNDIEISGDDAETGSTLLFSRTDPHGTGRPVRTHILMAKPRDGDRAEVWDLGGHPLPVGSRYRPGRGAITSSAQQ